MWRWILLAFLAVTPIFAARCETPVVVSDVRLAGDGQHTQITLILSQRVPVNVFSLADPARVIVDLPEVDFRLNSASGQSGKGLISAFRYGQFAPGQSRLVFDIRDPVLVGDVQLISTVEGAPHRITIELARTTRESFLKQINERGGHEQGSAVPPQKQASDNMEHDLPLVVLDPGHGGVDSGAQAANGVIEKNLTLEIAKEVKRQLEDTGTVRVALTREDDSFIPLQQRANFAREKKAALFISLHADSYKQHRELRGATVYTLSEKASDRGAAAYAERENRADEIAGIEHPPQSNEVADILFDLMQRETKSFSTVLSKQLALNLKDTIKLNVNPRRSAGFVVLRAPDTPSVLLELGYLSNAEDVSLMQSEEWRAGLGKAIARAVVIYLQQSRGKAAVGVP